MIEIPKGKTAAPAPASPGVAHDPIKTWGEYYKKHDETAGQLLQTLVILRDEKKFDDVEGALRGFLTYRSPKAEPWMYEMLAVAIERRKGSADEVKTLLGYAAFQAERTRNVNDLVGIADLLYRRGMLDPVGPPGRETTVAKLLDAARAVAPHRAEPLMMSINLAAKTKDPKRMADSVDRLLSVGWPGVDQKLRADARRLVNELAKSLREDGKEPEADALLAALPAMVARDVYVRLSWEGVDDLDIAVEEPHGTVAQLFKNPRTVLGGAIISNGYGNHPEEVYVCPRGFSGKYTVRVEPIYQPETPAKVATLEVITHEGTPEEKRTSHPIDLTKPEPITFELTGGRRTEVLPTVPPPVVVKADPANAAARRKVRAATPSNPPKP